MEDDVVLDTFLEVLKNMKHQIGLGQFRVVRRLAECMFTLAQNDNADHDKTKRYLNDACEVVKAIMNHKVELNIATATDNSVNNELQV